MTETTPIKLIDERSLPIAFRGYDRKATDGLFDELKTYVTTLLSEHGATQARVAELEKQLPAAQEKEKEITEALLVASRVRGESEHEGKELRAKYEREAEARLKAAAAEAEKILNEAKSRAHAFEEEARDAEQLGVRTREQLTTFLESLLTEIERRGRDLGSAVQELVERASETGRAGVGKLATLPTPQATQEKPTLEEQPAETPAGGNPPA